MSYTTPTDFAAGTVVTEAMLDNLSGNLSGGVVRPYADVVLSSPQATMDFTSIPSTFRSLKIVAQGRSDQGGVNAQMLVRLNNDSGNNYLWQIVAANATTPTATEGISQSSFLVGNVSAAGAPASSPGMYCLEIPFYALTTLNKCVIGCGGYRTSSATAGINVNNFWGQWASTAAINRVTFMLTAGNYVTGSAATLYVEPWA
jgi:hypothetical protein